MQVICPVCTLWISEWSVYTGKTTTVNAIVYHTSCLKNVTLVEVEKHARG